MVVLITACLCAFGALGACRAPERDHPSVTQSITLGAGEPVEVFVGGAGPSAVYRIPALARAGGSLLAFAEGRASLGDIGTNDLVLSTSKDHGASWSAPRTILDSPERSINNPCVVVLESGPHAGRVLVVVQSYPKDTHENAPAKGVEGDGVCRVHLLSSDDHGTTWSAPRDITASTRRPEATTVASGPGAAIQLRHGKRAGRIVVPFNQGPYGKWTVYTCFSDDSGETWSMGAVAPGGEPAHANEVQVAEREDGSLLLNARSFHGERRRLGAVSQDGGASWSDLAPITDLPDPCCQGTMLSLELGGRPMLAFTGCDSETARARGTLWVSTDGGASWPAHARIVDGFFAYSAIAELGLAVPDERVLGLLYEADDYKRIRFMPLIVRANAR